MDNKDQAAFWNNQAGPTWVAHQDALDQLMAPVLARVLAHSDLSPGHYVLDIGCGTGALTLDAAGIVGPTGSVTGADIATPMVVHAAQRSTGLDRVHLVLADAATHGFAPASFDRMVSRFGVMFFADPEAALRNLFNALKPDGRISFATWGQIGANPWFTLPAQIAKAELGAPPKSDPDAPGPFAIRDIERTCALLRRAGFANVTGVAEDLRLALPDGADQIAALSIHVGPAAGTIRHFEASDGAVARIRATMTEHFAAFGPQGIPAEINFFTATKTSLDAATAKA